MPPRAFFAVALLLAGVGATVLPSAFDEPPRAHVVGNVAVNASARDPVDITSHNSPSLARNPRDSRELAVANRIDNPRFSCALHVSDDGGAGWSPVRIPMPTGGGSKCFAPDVAYDAEGSLYLSFVTLTGRGNVPHAVWLSRLMRGRRLSRPVRLLGPLSFQVRLVADPVVPRRLYLTWLAASDVGVFQFSQPGNPIRFMRSDDGGRTWRAPVTVSDPARERVVAPSLAVAARGELHVVYLDLGDDRLDYAGAHRGQGGPPYPGPWGLAVSSSPDGGRSWTHAGIDDSIKPTERFIVFLPPFPSVAADPEGGRLYASFHDGRQGDPDVLLWASSDGGRSWSAPTRVNDTRPRDGRAQYLPRLAVAPDGRLDILYYDRRRDRADVRNEVSLQSSYDGGQTFSERVRLSERPFDSRIGPGNERGLPDLGSRLALDSREAAALGVWTDTRAGSRASQKQDVTAGLVTFSHPARLSGVVKHGLRYGGLLLVLAGCALLAALATNGRLGAWLRYRRSESARTR